MTTEELLELHRPILRYDSHEIYFADSAAEWTDSPHNELHDATGQLVASADTDPPLSLELLGRPTYPNGNAPSKDDRIGHSGRDYEQQARLLHEQDRYRNQMYGRSVKSKADGHSWLQYWFFYFYNDYNLAGDVHGVLGNAGLHEGDWEMIQLQLDGQDKPQLAVYSQHKHAGFRGWKEMEKQGDRPIVYPARGSHANYFRKTGLIPHWTGVWFDHSDGKGGHPEIALNAIDEGDSSYAWAKWPGYWGDTRPAPGAIQNPLDSTSPNAPCRHPVWGEPHVLLAAAKEKAAAGVPASPPVPPMPTGVTIRREGGTLHVTYESTGWPEGSEPAALVMTVNSPEDPLPPAKRSVRIHASSGDVDTGIEAKDDWSYDAAVSLVDQNATGSASTAAHLDAAS